MSNIDKTIEELSVSQSSGDLWDEFEENQNANLKMHYIGTGNSPIRFLGAFVSVYRYYSPDFKDFPQINIEGIADHNIQAIEEARRILQQNPRHSGVREMTEFLERAKSNAMTWQKCILVNVYDRALRRVKIAALTRKMKDSIIEKLRGETKAPITGVFAHDFVLSKNGEGLQTKFNVRVIAPNHLPVLDINAILHQGLIDIPTMIVELNKLKSSRYFYRRATNYKMPSEFMKELLAECNSREEDCHLRDTEAHLNDIPIEAFERRNNMRGAIGSLEV